MKGKVIIQDETKIRTGLVQFGVASVGIFCKNLPTILNIHGTMTFNGKATFGTGCALSVGPGSELTFGEDFAITAKSSVVASGGKHVTFGNNCLLSWEILVMNTDFHKIIQQECTINNPEDIRIGNNVWIGTQALVLKGSVVADGSIIGARTTVRGLLLDQHSIYVGSPARKVKSQISWVK